MRILYKLSLAFVLLSSSVVVASESVEEGKGVANHSLKQVSSVPTATAFGSVVIYDSKYGKIVLSQRRYRWFHGWDPNLRACWTDYTLPKLVCMARSVVGDPDKTEDFLGFLNNLFLIICDRFEADYSAVSTEGIREGLREAVAAEVSGIIP
jgi:hypothetical protein